MAIPNSQQAYADYLAAQKKYQTQQTGGAGFLAALTKALTGADGQNTTLRSQEQALTSQQFTEPTKYREELVGQGITDPYKRQALLDQRLGATAGHLTGVRGKLQDLGASRQQVVDTAGKAYDTETQVAMQQANSAGDFWKTILGQEQAEKDRQFQSRMDDLTRQEKQASIAAANRSNRGGGGGGLTLAQMLGLQQDNPLGYAQTLGYERKLAPNGGQGYFFYKNGQPVTVDEVANAIGGNKAALLAGSSNAADQQFVQSTAKPPTQTAKSANNNAQSGIRSLDKIESLYNEPSRISTLNKSRLPFGLGDPKAQQYNSARKEITDIIARLRTGAVINEQEEKLYRTYVPGPSDSEANARWKMDQLKQFFNGLTLGGGTSLPTVQDIVDTGI